MVLAIASGLSRLQRIPRILASFYVTLALFAMYFATVFFVYPYAYAQRFQGRGSDQADCVTIISSNILNFVYPYSHATSYLHNPCSTGLGEAIMFSPLVGLKLVQYGGLISIAGLVLILRRASSSWAAVNLFLLAMSTSEFMWEGLAVGTDFIPIGLSLAILTVLLCRYFEQPRRPLLSAVLLAVLGGFIVSSRVPLTYVPCVIGFLSWPKSRRRSLLIAGAMLAVTLLLHATPYFWSPANFTPLHLVGKTQNYVNSTSLVVIVTCFAILPAAYLLLRAFRRPDTVGWPMAIAVSIMIPMGLAAFGDLAYWHYDFVTWEGPNYLMVSEPLLALAMVMALLRRIEAQSRGAAAALL